MAQTRHGVTAPWRVDFILTHTCTKNDWLSNHVFCLVKSAETLEFGAVISEGFSEPPDLGGRRNHGKRQMLSASGVQQFGG